MFRSKMDEEEGPISSHFLEVLDRAPDKPTFLGDFWQRIHPRGWSGSLTDVLVGRRGRLTQLETHGDASVRQWVADMQPDFDRWIDSERSREREKEESFE